MRRRTKLMLVVAAGGLLGLGIATRQAMAPVPPVLGLTPERIVRAGIVDRRGEPLAVTYANPLNADEVVPLSRIPPLLASAFVEAEDRDFFAHHGVDWTARLAAAVQNLRAGRIVRGASTITEQVARMLHPRSRSLWSRWVQGFEARRLEQRFTKHEILEFYLNHVPYPRRRHGVCQAARDLFDRDLDTLRPREMLALAVIVRNPAGLDARRKSPALDAAVERLADRLRQRGVLDDRAYEALLAEPLELREGRAPVEASHFVAWVREAGLDRQTARVRTTLDAGLEQRVATLLTGQLTRLASQGVGDGAVLVVDHTTDEVLAWVDAGGSQIDAVRTPRQPGSTLKPFLYATALEHGATAATLIDDSALAAPIGAGLHRFRNYSRTFHGPVRLRQALGSSLNIPAVRTLQSVTPRIFHARLHELGFASLDRETEFYGDGLALGSGEVSLLELVQAYAVLARGGWWRPLRATLDPPAARGPSRRVLEAETCSLITDILADPDARSLEFGRGGLLELPLPTAVKTGTSSDYHDAWAVGFSARHVVGVWLGNLDRREMDGVSGSIGPALVLRAVFAELAREAPPCPLLRDPHLARHAICSASGGAAGPRCPALEEWFRPRDLPLSPCRLHRGVRSHIPTSECWNVRPDPILVQPTPGLHLAADPRIPDALESFAFRVDTPVPPVAVEWFVDGVLAMRSGPGERTWLWPVTRGEHRAQARVQLDAGAPALETEVVPFRVR